MRFCTDYPDAAPSLRLWWKVVTKAEWANSAEVKTTYPHASIVSATRVVFNIRHTDYRLVVAIRYDKKRMYLRFFGTHKKYDQINAATI